MKTRKLDIGARGFEPPTSWSRTKRATRLRYAPTRTVTCGDLTSDERPNSEFSLVTEVSIRS